LLFASNYKHRRFIRNIKSTEKSSEMDFFRLKPTPPPPQTKIKMMHGSSNKSKSIVHCAFE
jgi:hypothetical protein